MVGRRCASRKFFIVWDTEPMHRRHRPRDCCTSGLAGVMSEPGRSQACIDATLPVLVVLTASQRARRRTRQLSSDPADGVQVRAISNWGRGTFLFVCMSGWMDTCPLSGLPPRPPAPGMRSFSSRVVVVLPFTPGCIAEVRWDATHSTLHGSARTA